MAVIKDGYTYRKLLFSIVFCVFFPIVSGRGPLFALDRTDEREDLWVCPGAEIALYSISSMAYGGGLALGYGNRASIGIKAAYLLDAGSQLSTLEINFLFRLYFLRAAVCSGPFIQINGGPAFIAKDSNLSVPSEFGTISAGLSLGWRFLLGRYVYIEPVIRGGYPYIVGAGLFAGVHFYSLNKENK